MLKASESPWSPCGFILRSHRYAMCCHMVPYCSVRFSWGVDYVPIEVHVFYYSSVQLVIFLQFPFYNILTCDKGNKKIILFSGKVIHSISVFWVKFCAFLYFP